PGRGASAGAGWKKFGPDGSIATAEACTAARGRFFPQLFGWMVHVYPFEKTLDKVWAVQYQIPNSKSQIPNPKTSVVRISRNWLSDLRFGLWDWGFPAVLY